jgi:uncharacterized protein (DUF4415 family)
MTLQVRRTLADSPMTPARKRELAKLAARTDSEIDFSEIPPLTDSFWKNAVRNPFYRPVKQQLTVRLDADVVAWLRRQGKGYQTRLNQVLREAMLEESRKALDGMCHYLTKESKTGSWAYKLSGGTNHERTSQCRFDPECV